MWQVSFINFFPVSKKNQAGIELSDHKRDFLVIVSVILGSLMSGILKKTHISYRARLDSRLTDKYLSLMRSSGLVIFSEDDPKFFKITSRGIYFLETFQKIEELLRVERKDTVESSYILVENSLRNYKR